MDWTDRDAAGLRESTALNAKTLLENVSCARLPASSLAALAGLRRAEGLTVRIEGDQAWVFWSVGNDRILRAIFPVEGVELFEQRDGIWYRSGRQMPSFEVPDDAEAVAIHQAIVPDRFEAIPPTEASPVPSRLRLVREGIQRPSTAVLCPLAELERWADSATSHEIESARGALRGETALLLGRGLPIWPGSTRYWGDRVLVPIGFQVRPTLPESAIFEALGGSGLELFRFLDDGPDGADAAVESIPFDAFRPLTRAGLRIALKGRSS